jgi:hypothetical protein
MVTYKQLNSILLKDGKKYIVDLTSWAQETLTGADYSNFMNDSAEIIQFYKNLEDSGELTITKVTENISDINLTIIIGRIFTWTNQRVEHEKHALWQARFAADPNVTYNPEVLQS